MATEKKLPKGVSRYKKWYMARISVDGHQYYLGIWPTIQDAKTALSVAYGQKAAGTFIPPAERRRLAKAQREQGEREALTVRQWSALWLEGLERADKTPGTIRAHKSLLDVHILPVLGDKRLVDVTEDDVTALVEKLKAMPSKRHTGAKTNGVWANAARTLRAMFNSAVDVKAGGLTASPVKVAVPKTVRVEKVESDTDVATPAEVRAFTEAMPDHLAIAIPLAAWCSLRIGEVLGLQRRDFEDLDHPERAQLYVRRQWNTKLSPPDYTDPKAESVRHVSIPASIVPAIVAHLDEYTGPDPKSPLLPGSVDPHKPVSQTALDKAWREARTGVRPGFRFHALRHTGLTEYGRQGATLVELMKRGGHKDMKTAMRYQHADVERDRRLTNKLDQMIGETHE